MLKSCKYCGRIHPVGYVCPKKPKRERSAYYDDSEAAAFRRKQSWKDMSMTIRERDNHLCQICIRNRYLTSHPLTHVHISVHHITPLTEDMDGALDTANLISLCDLHHELAEEGIIPREELRAIAESQNRKAGW